MGKKLLFKLSFCISLLKTLRFLANSRKVHKISKKIYKKSIYKLMVLGYYYNV
jgi:hypothetical protein